MVPQAIQLAKAFDDLGVQAHIGVTTGKVFAGVIGPPHRCEFSLLGDTVNLAARLLGKAPFGGVLCDESTYESAKLTMEYVVLCVKMGRGWESGHYVLGVATRSFPFYFSSIENLNSFRYAVYLPQPLLLPSTHVCEHL